jgi:hypothetical protein
MPQLAIINQSTIVTDAEGNIITSALNQVLPQFCSDWGIVSHSCVYVAKGKTTTIPLKIFLLDTSDVANLLAYHDEINDIPYGRAFAKTVLSYGGVILYSQNPRVLTFAQCVCHEVFELLINPNCNVWTMLSDNNTLYAYEVCDPVQSNPVTVSVKTGTITTPVYVRVGLSDWVLPNWFDPQKKRGPYNHNNTLTAPFTVSNYGYVMRLTNGKYEYVWGQRLTTEDKQTITDRLGTMVKSNFKITGV